MPVPGRPHLMIMIKFFRSSVVSRRLAPSGIWVSILRPSPAQPWQAWQLAFFRNSLPPSAISDGSAACAHAIEPESRANSALARDERSALLSLDDGGTYLCVPDYSKTAAELSTTCRV